MVNDNGQENARLRFDTPHGTLELTLCTPRLLRVRYGTGGERRGPSYLPPQQWPPVAYTVQAGARTIIETEAMVVEVDALVPRLTVRTAGGPSLRYLPTLQTAAPRLQANFKTEGEQHFYGLGEGGPQFDRHGGVRQFWNSHVIRARGSDIGVPLLLSTAGYALFFDNTADAALTIGRSDGDADLLYRAEDGDLDWYYLAAATPRELLGEVATLLGRASLPPRWALGFLQSTRHFTDASEVDQLPLTMRARKIPCDALIFLSTYGRSLSWNRGVGHLDYQPELWPDPAARLATLREQGFQVILHEYPVLHRESPLFATASQRGYLLDEGYHDERHPSQRPDNFQEGQRYLDFTHPEVAAWWWDQHRPLLAQGVSGWWLDGGEGPAATTDLAAGRGRLWHNLYDRLRQAAFATHQSADAPGQRPFLLCRSGAAGMQRYGASCWSGDINNTFATLEDQIPRGLNTGLSGIPYWGTDVGGFFHPIAESGELFARWFQFGAFSPIFRAHGWVWREHLPWAHGPAIEEICRFYADLRYRLLPYTYTMAWQAWSEGLPLMRPLVLNYPDDPRTWELGSQYLWGDDLLVAPVTREGATAWSVYLPTGLWYDYWTQQRYEGPCGVTVAAPLERLPLFVRAGAIIPLAPSGAVTTQDVGEELTLLIYPHERSSFTLYDDDGSSQRYQDGHHALTRIDCTASTAQIRLQVHRPTGDTGLIPAGRRYQLRIYCTAPRQLSIDGRAVEQSAGDSTTRGWWRDSEGMVQIPLPSTAHEVSLTL